MKKVFRLDGEWHKITYNEAAKGKIGMLFFDYTLNKENNFEFYTIFVADHVEHFSYFIGVHNPFSDFSIEIDNAIIEENVSDIVSFYEAIINQNIKFLELMNSSVNNYPIPFRIEKYCLNNDHLEVKEIIIPIKP